MPGELNIYLDSFKLSYSFHISYLCSVMSFFVFSKSSSQRTALLAVELWETPNYFAWSPLAIAAWFVFPA